MKIEILSSQKHISSHSRKSTGGTIDHMCDRGDCGKTFKDNYSLLQHLDLHDNNLAKCFFCPWGAPAKNGDKISTHFDQHFNNPKFKCSYCNKIFFRKREVKDHIEIFHEKDHGKYKCFYCSFKAYSRVHLNRHLRKEHK